MDRCVLSLVNCEYTKSRHTPQYLSHCKSVVSGMLTAHYCTHMCVLLINHVRYTIMF